jgi:hypothetical protein
MIPELNITCNQTIEKPPPNFYCFPPFVKYP